MSQMSELSIEIQEKLHQGQRPGRVAQLLDVPVTWVYELADPEEETFSPYATINS